MTRPEPALAERVLAAYGGRDTWERAQMVRLELSAWGWAFRLKWQRPMRRAKVELAVHSPIASIFPMGGAGCRGILDGTSVRIENEQGTVLEERADARRFFPGGRRALWWDRLDQTYFAGYAAWNYFTFPALLLREDIEWIEVRPDTLEARFHEGIPTHSAVQRFHFDPKTALLLQHDYTADVIGGWAKAANVVIAHSEANGIWYASSRRVYPRGGDGTAKGWPLLVGIEAHAYEVV